MDEHQCGNCTTGTEDGCECPCHAWQNMKQMRDAAMQAQAKQLSNEPMQLGFMAFFIVPEVPWPCKKPIVTVLCTRRRAKYLGATFWN
jgi:hypothetical protein